MPMAVSRSCRVRGNEGRNETNRSKNPHSRDASDAEGETDTEDLDPHNAHALVVQGEDGREMPNAQLARRNRQGRRAQAEREEQLCQRLYKTYWEPIIEGGARFIKGGCMHSQCISCTNWTLGFYLPSSCHVVRDPTIIVFYVCFTSQWLHRISEAGALRPSLDSSHTIVV